MLNMNARPQAWDPQRLVHRQTYIDLVRAYLLDYGTQRDLARALGLSEAYLSYLLEPVKPDPSRTTRLYWSDLLRAADHELAEAFRFAKTPSPERARQIAEQICGDTDRREAVLYHIDLARMPLRPPAAAQPERMSADETTAALREAGAAHGSALHDTRAPVTAAAYTRVWRLTRHLPTRLDPARDPAGHAQALMFLHDTAQVLGRVDLALGYAREATGRLGAAVAGRFARDEMVSRFRVNAMLAEAVSLNSLGLQGQAAAAIRHSETLTGYRYEPGTWQRSFLEQRLRAMTGLSRASVYDAERTADRALCLVPADYVIQAGIKRRLLDVYLGRPTDRSLRKAVALAAELHLAADNGSSLSPLRRAQVLRTLTTYYRAVGDHKASAASVRQCLKITEESQLHHQRRQLAAQALGAGRAITEPTWTTGNHLALGDGWTGL